MIWISGDCIGVMLEIPINYSRVGNLVEQLNSFLLAKYSAVSVKIMTQNSERKYVQKLFTPQGKKDELMGGIQSSWEL
jgi:hypothetical protein